MSALWLNPPSGDSLFTLQQSWDPPQDKTVIEKEWCWSIEYNCTWQLNKVLAEHTQVCGSQFTVWCCLSLLEGLLIKNLTQHIRFGKHRTKVNLNDLNDLLSADNTKNESQPSFKKCTVQWGKKIKPQQLLTTSKKLKQKTPQWVFLCIPSLHIWSHSPLAAHISSSHDTAAHWWELSAALVVIYRSVCKDASVIDWKQGWKLCWFCAGHELCRMISLASEQYLDSSRRVFQETTCT